MRETIGVIGLGRMGFAMTETLLREGFTIFVYDVLPTARERAGSIGASVADNLPALFSEARIVVSSLPLGADVEAIVAGKGGLLASAPEPGTLLVDTSTSEPATGARMVTVSVRQSSRRSVALHASPIDRTTRILRSSAT